MEIWTATVAELLDSGQTIAEHTQEAIQLYSERIDTEPEDAENYVARAAYHIYLNDSEKAQFAQSLAHVKALVGKVDGIL